MDNGIQIKVDDKDVLKRLGELHDAASNMQPLYEKIGAGLLFRTQRNFETETAPDGTKWPRLKPRTAAQRIGSGRRGYENMLRVKNRLFQSVTYQADAASAVVGTNVIYAAIHNMGGEIKQPERKHTIYQRYDQKTDTLNPRFVKRSRSNFARDVTMKAHTINMPAREFLGFADGDRNEVLRIAAEHFAAAAGNGGTN